MSKYNFIGVKGPKFTIKCVQCGSPTWFGSDPTNGFADLNGEAFKAYYCADCVAELLEAETKAEAR